MSALREHHTDRLGLRHEALLHRGDDDFRAAAAAFLRAGVEAGEAALVAVAPTRIPALQQALGRDADSVRFIDMRAIGGNPGRIISVWQDFIAEHTGQTLRGIGEPVWPERSADELAECAAHEALLNTAFPEAPLWLLCPYDLDALPDDALALAHRTHPALLADGAVGASSEYTAPNGALLSQPLPEPAAAVRELAFRERLNAVRQAVYAEAAAAGLSPARADELVLAISEAAGNSLRHGSGGGVLRTWREPNALVCEVRDQGVIADPLVGRLRPADDQPGGRGLWIAHQLCDLVQLRSGPGGTVVRLHMRLV